MSSVRARAIWLKVHLYLALTVGAFIAVLGLSGSVLAFYPEVDRLLNPALRVVAPEAPRISADLAAARAAAHSKLEPALVWMPRDDHAVFAVELFNPRLDEYHLVAVSALTGEVLADRVWGATLVTFLFDLHATLLMGEPGLILVGVLAFVLIASVITGLWLWWPRHGGFRRALSFRPARALLPFTFELHRIGGAYLAVVLLVIALSGVYLAVPSMFTGIVGVFANVSPDLEASPPRSGSDSAPRLSISEIQRIVRERVPHARIASISLPQDVRDAYAVRFIDRAEPESRNGRSTIWIDASTGAVLRSHAYSGLPRADRFLALQLPLHTGEVLGTPGRALASLAGFATFALYISGLYLWWKRRPARPART